MKEKYGDYLYFVWDGDRKGAEYVKGHVDEKTFLMF